MSDIIAMADSNTRPMGMEESNCTIRMADNKTRPMGAEKSNRLRLKKDIVFKGANDTYEIFAGSCIGIGGESQVYLATRGSNGAQVAAKIYNTYADSELIRFNRKRIISFLTKNSDYKKTHIMPLLDHGTTSIESDDGEDFIKPIDIIPYCKNGTLKRCDYKRLKNKIIPDVLHALNLLHASNLVHRDIKPNNLYELDGEVILSDFGTTSEIIDSKYALVTVTQRGTLGYTAPEISDKYFVIASDYYSLGCTIASLYKGKHVYQTLLDSNDIGRLNIAMRRSGLPLDCLDSEADLQTLVDALVVNEEKQRAGYVGVKLWLDNPQAFMGKWADIIRQQRNEKPLLGFPFEDKVYNDETELTKAMLEKWDKAKEYLYRGHIKGFFQQKNPSLANKAYDIVEKEATHNQDLGLAMFLHYFNTTDKPNCPIYWHGKAYEKLSDISTVISDGKADESKIVTMFKDKFLSWKSSNSKESAGEYTIDVIKDVEDITAAYPRLGCYTFMYIFAPAKDKKSLTSDDVFRKLTKNNTEWYEKVRKLFNNDETFAYLISIGYKKQILDLKTASTATSVSDVNSPGFTLLYGLFESICKDKTAVRKHYLQYGPWAYLYWLHQNLHLYSFNSAAAKDIERKIKNVKIDEKMSVADMSKGLLSLSEILKDFMPMFQNNYLLTLLGLRTSQDTTGITTKYPYAFFVGDFFGINVPVGYLKIINK